ncbi:alpha/beta hydrolase family protein [Chloroflexota bacterium]
MNPYSYLRRESRFSVHLKKETSHWHHYLVSFPTAHPSQYKENNTAWGEYFIPASDGRFPLVILLHGMGDKTVVPCRVLARYLAKRGIASFVLYLPFHSKRTPETMRGKILPLSAATYLEVFQISVVEVRQIIDWAEGEKKLDDKRIAIIGVSLGGFASAIAMGLDKRIMAGVFLVTGGNLEEMTWNSRSSALRKAHNCTRAECHCTYSLYHQYLDDIAQKGFENVTPAEKCFLFDPITFASFLRGRPMLMINALWDSIIPRRSTLDFWEASGRPQISWYPSTHITIYLWFPFIFRKITNFITLTFSK